MFVWAVSYTYRTVLTELEAASLPQCPGTEPGGKQGRPRAQHHPPELAGPNLCSLKKQSF